jgi:hypothetical protein
MLCSISLVHAKSSGCVDLFTGNVFWGRQGPLDASLFSNVVLVPPPRGERLRVYESAHGVPWCLLRWPGVSHR